MRDDLGDRMKRYEDSFRSYLTPHLPVIIRVDGKAFHSLTKKADKPFDADIERLMDATALYLCKNVATVQLAYVQSDEISLLLHPYKKLTSQPWFDNNLQKMVSVAASMATAAFNEAARQELGPVFENVPFCNKFERKLPAIFDARAFILPECEVVNYFIWRQQDASRNSVSMLARSVFSHKEVDGKNGKEMKEMLLEKGKSWDDLPTKQKRGRCVIKTEVNTGFEGFRRQWLVDNEIPIFTQDRSYIERYVGHVKDESDEKA